MFIKSYRMTGSRIYTPFPIVAEEGAVQQNRRSLVKNVADRVPNRREGIIDPTHRRNKTTSAAEIRA